LARFVKEYQKGKQRIQKKRLGMSRESSGARNAFDTFENGQNEDVFVS